MGDVAVSSTDGSDRRPAFAQRGHFRLGQAFWRIPLQAKLVLPVLIVILLATLAVARFELQAMGSNSDAAAQEMATRQANLVTVQYQHAPADQAHLRSLIQDLVSASPQVDAIQVYTYDPAGGATLAAAAGLSPVTSAPASALASPSWAMLTGTKTPIWEYAAPLTGSSYGGEVRVFVTEPLRAALAGTLVGGLIAVLLIELVAVVVLARVWNHWLIERRLTRLGLTAAGLADGVFDPQLEAGHGRFSPGDELSAVGLQLGRLWESVSLRRHRQAELDSLMQDAAGGLGLADILNRAARLLNEGIGAQVAGVYEVFPPTGTLILRAKAGSVDPAWQLALMTPEQYHDQVLLAEGPVEIERTPATIQEVTKVRRIFAAIRIPGRTSPFGMLIMGSDADRFTNDQLDFLKAVGHTIATAVNGLHDPLTGLPNRLLFEDRLTQALSEGQRSGDAVCLYYVDLDNFKEVNDTMGHQAGDLLLSHVADRLRKVLRSSDLLARLGGDEFALVQTLGPVRTNDPSISLGRSAGDLPRDKIAADTAARLIDTLSVPFTVDSARIYVAASIGIAIFPEHGSNPSVLSRNADRAMYEAKLTEKGTFRVFSPAMHASAVRRLRIETGLRTALQHDQLRLAYQPQVDVLRPGNIVGFEALLRWKEPRGRDVSPTIFIPVAEQSGLIGPIGLWALNKACLQVVEWQRTGLPPVKMAVNVAASQFAGPDFVANVKRVLDETGVNPALIELEITEGSVLRNIDEVTKKLQYLRDLGLSIAVDDFGTGYSSLAYLHRLPFDSLKVDRSFVRNIASKGENRDTILVRSIVQLGRSLKKVVVAEGVETPSQLLHLQRLGCDVGQGYLFARPTTADQASKMLSAVGAEVVDAPGALAVPGPNRDQRAV